MEGGFSKDFSATVPAASPAQDLPHVCSELPLENSGFSPPLPSSSCTECYKLAVVTQIQAGKGIPGMLFIALPLQFVGGQANRNHLCIMQLSVHSGHCRFIRNRNVNNILYHFTGKKDTFQTGIGNFLKYFHCFLWARRKICKEKGIVLEVMDLCVNLWASILSWVILSRSVCGWKSLFFNHQNVISDVNF